MKLVNMIGDRFRETPADCQIISQIFMIRGGYMKQVANGIYSLYMPARRIVRKIARESGREAMLEAGKAEIYETLRALG